MHVQAAPLFIRLGHHGGYRQHSGSIKLTLKQAIGRYEAGSLAGMDRRGLSEAVGAVEEGVGCCSGSWLVWGTGRVRRFDALFGVGDAPACVAGGCWGGVVVGVVALAAPAGWLEDVGEAEERAEPWVVGKDAPAYGSSGREDLGGDLDERRLEGPEVHGEQASALFVVALGPARGDW